MTVTTADITAVIDTNRNVQPFLDTASLIVSEDLQGKGLSSSRLDEITIYLAAHFVAITEEKGGLRREKTGDAEDAYVTPTKVDSGLAMTRYGQQALILDSSGTLAKISAGSKLAARFEVLEQPRC
jgi:hypothetical protein